MKWANILRRWTVRSIHSAILGTALSGSVAVTFAQSPQALGKLPAQNYTRSLTFDLPVSIDAETRATLSEIQLYVKTPTSQWRMQEGGSQLLTRFACRVQQEGEYWYSLVMVDRSGRKTPADVSTVAPLQRVVVDTTPPVIQVQPVHSPDREYCLKCTIQDANPDPLSLKAVCKTDAGDLPLEMLPNYPGVFRVKGSELMKFPVIISAVDMAKNVGTREVNVRDLLQAALASGPALTPIRGPDILPAGVPNGLQQQPYRPDAPPYRPEAYAYQPSPGPRLDPGPRNDWPVAPSAQYHRTDSPPAQSNFISGGTGGPPSWSPPPNDDRYMRPHGLPNEMQGRVDGPYQLIQTRQASVEYRIDQVGTSGVGRVEVFMTPDQGQSWQRLGEDHDRHSPADITLPGDGVFGIRIVISNGNGFGGRPPARGDAPQCTIEVDSTAPFLQMRSAELLPGNGEVEIRWSATDKNLGPAPINLFYRTRPDLPWQPVARNLKNDGVYRWAFPREISSQFYFMIQAVDLAGNVAQAGTHEPILIDTSVPRATVLGVIGAGSSPSRMSPGGAP